MPQIKKILVPTDFSENASVAHKYAQKAAESYGAKITLIHIIPKLHYFNVNLSSLDLSLQNGNMAPNLKTEATHKLKNEMERYIAPENQGDVIAEVESRPSRGVSDYAKSNDYDLILMAARGRHNSEFLRGSVAEKVIRIAYKPVLTINKAYNPDIKTIALPSDGSKVSLEALPMALHVASHRKAELKMVSVSENLEKDGHVEIRKERLLANLKEFITQEDGSFSIDNEADINVDSEINLKNAAGDDVKLSIEVIAGKSAHHTIVDYAKNHTELLIMGTHGRSGLSNLFLGSTAEKVVRHLKMPVMTIRPDFAKNK